MARQEGVGSRQQARGPGLGLGFLLLYQTEIIAFGTPSRAGGLVGEL